MPGQRTHGGRVPRLRSGNQSYYLSNITTATGSAQSLAHGLGRVPARVLILILGGHNGSGAAGASFPTLTPGTHTSTNCVVTLTAGATFQIEAS